MTSFREDSGYPQPEREMHENASPPGPVSIVITTFNHARFLNEAIESALRQTVGSGEVIVVDDGSTDNPASVVRRYPQVRLILQENRGLAAARNTGWRAASGRYLIFLDADDRLTPEAVAVNAQFLKERPECAFVYGSFDLIDVCGRHLDAPPLISIGEDAYETFLRGNCVRMHATVMYRRDCLEEIGGFDETLPCCEDYDVYLRLSRRYRVAAVTERIAQYRRHDGSMSTNIPRMLDTALAVLRRQAQSLGDHSLWREAYRAGIQFWKSTYAEAQVSRTLTTARKCGLRHVPWRATAKVFAIAPRASFRFTCWRLLMAVRARVMLFRRKSVRFGDLRQLQPISRDFGYDRGKPVDRRYIEDFLSHNGGDIRGRVLEIGDNSYTIKYGGARVSRSDVLHVSSGSPKATLVGDLADGHNLPSETFDCIVLTQTLHLIFDTGRAVASLHRMLKAGGVLLATVPGVSSIDNREWRPVWFWSLSAAALRRLLEEKFGSANVHVTSYGNVLAAVAFLHGLAERELRPRELDNHDPQYPVIVAGRAVKAMRDGP